MTPYLKNDQDRQAPEITQGEWERGRELRLAHAAADAIRIEGPRQAVTVAAPVRYRQPVVMIEVGTKSRRQFASARAARAATGVSGSQLQNSMDRHEVITLRSGQRVKFYRHGKILCGVGGRDKTPPESQSLPVAASVVVGSASGSVQRQEERK